MYTLHHSITIVGRLSYHVVICILSGCYYVGKYRSASVCVLVPTRSHGSAKMCIPSHGHAQVSWVEGALFLAVQRAVR